MDLAAPGWWTWALCVPGLAIMAWLLARGFVPERPEVPRSRWTAPGLLAAVLLHLAFGWGMGNLAGIPFLPPGWALGAGIVLSQAFTLLVVLSIVRLAGQPPAALGLQAPRRPANFLSAGLLYLSFLAPLGLLAWAWIRLLASFGFSPEAQPALRSYFDSLLQGDWAGLWLIVLGAVVLAPVVEEVLFRGFIFGFFRDRIGPAGGVILTSLAFAAFHVHPEVVVPIFLVGVVLNLIYLRTGNLSYAIAFHILFNGGTLLWTSLSLPR